MYEFALGLNRQLAAEGDLVWSPYSVASALALTATAARGRAYDEIVAVLGGAPDGLGLAEAAALRDAEITVANTLWFREGLPVEEEYERQSGAATHSADFAGDPEGAREAINADVAKTTRELIRDLLAPGLVDSRTAAIIVNALYLKVAWRNPFAESSTLPVPFRGPGGRRRVPMMRRTGRMPYAEVDGWRMVTLQAGGGVVADVLLGPEDGPAAPESLRPLYEAARAVPVSLTVPKFRLETGTSLVEPLAALGVRTAFSGEADFSRLTPERLCVSLVEHKAVLDVDEKGFEGAAATAVIMVTAVMDVGQPVEFRVDRPFLVVVRHPAAETVYFLARVTEP
ncbi:MAG TPA: serpin family protein [Actinoallomurus sp.]|nr:serpin family protein [Actinoallomurus sp.]